VNPTTVPLDQCRRLGDLADFCHGHRTGAEVVVDIDGERVVITGAAYEGTDDDLRNTLVLHATKET
jgi:hypothetical protein